MKITLSCLSSLLNTLQMVTNKIRRGCQWLDTTYTPEYVPLAARTCLPVCVSFSKPSTNILLDLFLSSLSRLLLLILYRSFSKHARLNYSCMTVTISGTLYSISWYFHNYSSFSVEITFLSLTLFGFRFNWQNAIALFPTWLSFEAAEDTVTFKTVPM